MSWLLRGLFIVLIWATATFSAYQLAYLQTVEWLIVLLMALAPLLQKLVRWDRQVAHNAKLRQPLVSLVVLLGIAALLLLVPEPGLALWLGLAVLGGYLLDTYSLGE